jgi:4-coumarate--CoA ligase
MVITSRWTEPIPSCSLQQWIFGSSQGALPSDQPLLIDADRPETHFLTKEGYRLLSKRVALGLIDAGLKPGDRVLLFSGNNLFFPSVFLGIIMAGGIFTGANPTYVARELAYQLSNSGASFMIANAGSLDTALQAAKEAGLPQSRVYVFDSPANMPKSERPSPGTAGRVQGIKHWTELLQGNLARAGKWDWTEPADPSTATCCLNYSSGTTGVPKGVEITHRAYIANGVGVVANAALAPDHDAALARSRGLCFLPLYHAYGQTYFIANLPQIGTPAYIMPGFDFEKMLQHIERFRVTSISAVPPILVALAKHPLAKKYDLSSIETVGCGAAPLGKEVMDEVQARLWPAPGQVKIRQGWGMTEVTCTCMSWDPNVEGSVGAAVGELMPNCAARLVAADGSEITRPNVPGELWVTGPTLLKGYWRNEAATRDTVVAGADGTRWLRTGDVAFVDRYGPGAIFSIVDRLKELIKVKGNQVAPAELEAVLLDNRDVADAAVVGVTIGGEEVPRAYVVKVAGAKSSARDIARWMEDKVARHKRLKGGVAFVDAVPKNPVSFVLTSVR